MLQLTQLWCVFAGGSSCTLEVLQALPILKKAYGDSMHKVLHVGPDSCSLVSSLLAEEDVEAWGIEPYELDDVGAKCKSLVRKGIVRVADIKFPLPYRAKSFSLVIVSDALDYLSPKYLNKTLPELVRVSADSVVIFSGTSPPESSYLLVYAFVCFCRDFSFSWIGYPGQPRARGGEVAKFGRPVSDYYYLLSLISFCQYMHVGYLQI